jgi:hypothetical protein
MPLDALQHREEGWSELYSIAHNGVSEEAASGGTKADFIVPAILFERPAVLEMEGTPGGTLFWPYGVHATDASSSWPPLSSTAR